MRKDLSNRVISPGPPNAMLSSPVNQVSSLTLNNGEGVNLLSQYFMSMIVLVD